jgi:hypothetical protein
LKQGKKHITADFAIANLNSKMSTDMIALKTVHIMLTLKHRKKGKRKNYSYKHRTPKEDMLQINYDQNIGIRLIGLHNIPNIPFLAYMMLNNRSNCLLGALH